MADASAPVTTVTPAGGLFSGATRPVRLATDEPATIYLRTDGRDPVIGEAGVSAYDDEASLTLVTDTDLRFFAVDRFGHREAVRSALFRLDRDADSVADLTDNCLYVATDQADIDLDGTGDACDSARCGDGLLDPESAATTATRPTATAARRAASCSASSTSRTSRPT